MILRNLFTSCLVSLVFFRGFVCAEQQTPYFTLITVPKSGSHMMIKTLYFLLNSPPIWHTKFPSLQYVPIEEGFLYTHFCLSPCLEADYEELPKLKKIILIRDFRDVAVSIVKQIKKAPWPGLTGEQRKQFIKMSFADQLLFVINYEYEVQDVAEDAPNSMQASLVRIAKQALECSKKPDVLTFRYEDLVGAAGGGSFATQCAQIKRLKEFLNLDLEDCLIENIAAKLYGDEVNPFGRGGFANYESTFNIGVIGKWKQYFNEQHKLAFKAKFGDTLVELGYEADNNW